MPFGVMVAEVHGVIRCGSSVSSRGGGSASARTSIPCTHAESNVTVTNSPCVSSSIGPATRPRRVTDG